MTELLDESVEQKLTVTDDENRVVVRIALFCTLYFENGYVTEVRERVADCFADYFKLCGSHLNWVKNPTTYKWHRVNSSTLPAMKNWLLKLDPNDCYVLDFHGDEDEYVASQFCVSALGAREWEQEMSYFKAVLPITWFADHPGSFPAFALNFCRKLRPVSGYGGLGIIDSASGMLLNEYEPTVTRIAQQFPGLEVDYPYFHTLHLNDGIKGVNWLTILGDRWLAEVGGVVALRAKLSADFVFHEFPGGIVIQAGSRPQMGDSAKNRLPELYVQLNAVLKPIRIKSHYAFHHAGEGQRLNLSASEKWLSRFD